MNAAPSSMTRHSTDNDLRIGSVRYLNAVPLNRGLEGEARLGTPAQLAEWLRNGEVDAALVSVAEVLRNGQYDLLDGIALASHGPVLSVFLAHRPPLEKLTEVHLDPASITGTTLLHILLAERGLRPKTRPLTSYESVGDLDAVLLIGDVALDFIWEPHPHQIWDLGQAWYELTGLPFVFAAWALRRGMNQARMCERLRRAHNRGMAELDQIIAERTEYDVAFRSRYYRMCMKFGLGAAEKNGVARFGEYMVRHGRGPVYSPRFVG